MFGRRLNDWWMDGMVGGGLNDWWRIEWLVED